ncbi:MAG: hypothetical protein ACLP01_32965 [Solirubrobacteraceae bacterium]
MTDVTHLERRYRRLLAWYPKAFRREHEDEMLVVLMAGAGNGQRRPGLADSADLIRNASWMRVRPWAQRPAPTVVWALRLMVLAAALELVALATVVGTQAGLRAAIIGRFPHFTAAQWQAEAHAHILPIEIGAPIAAAVWLGLAWVNGRGYGWARGLAMGLLGLTSISLLAGVGQHAANYAPADLIAGCALWLVGLLTVLLIFNPRSDPHYHQPSDRHDGKTSSSTADRPATQHVARDGGVACWN